MGNALKQIINSFLKKSNINTNTSPNALLGKWKTDPQDITTIEQFGSTFITFNPDNTLVYEIDLGDKVQKIFMTYKVEGQWLLTDQPSAPKPEKTMFKLENQKLELYFNGIRSVYIKFLFTSQDLQ